jgi:cytochrome c biogenesis protein CcmG, thiol:disulfide interchange protein DsbE
MLLSFFMKKIFFILIIGLPLHTSAQKKNVQNFVDSLLNSTQLHYGATVDSFVGKTVSGKIISNQNLKGKITLLCFWFESCMPCIAEFPALNNLVKEIGHKTQFQLIGVTFDPINSIKVTTRKNNLKFPSIHLSNSKCDSLNFNYGYPTLILVDRLAKIRYISIGGPTSTYEVKEKFEKDIKPRIRKLLN